jgi:uncharacterized Fe-S radical SAM superfamily protein PflX
LENSNLDFSLRYILQFRPAYHANKYPQLDRNIAESEYKEVMEYAFFKGIRRATEEYI